MKPKGITPDITRAITAVVVALVLVACGGDAAPGDGSSGASSGAAETAPAQGAVDSSVSVELPEEELGGLDADNVALAVRWTTSRIAGERRADATPVTAVGSVDHTVVAGIDRMTIGFADEGTLPSYEVASTIQPVTPCAEGAEPIAPEGEGMLRIRLSGVEVGDDVTAALPDDSGLGNVFAVHETCREDGEAEWVMDVERATYYRVLHLSNPTRLVVDVRHNLDGTPASTP